VAVAAGDERAGQSQANRKKGRLDGGEAFFAEDLRRSRSYHQNGLHPRITKRIGDQIRIGLKARVGGDHGVKLFRRDAETRPMLYVSHRQTRMFLRALFIRSQGDPAAMAETVRRQMRALDPKLPVSDIQPLSDIAAESLEVRAFISTLLSVFAAAAILLAAVGIYGVIAFLSAQRTQEIGVSIALGAKQVEVRRLVVRQLQ